MRDDDTKLSDRTVTQPQNEFANAEHGHVTCGWTKRFFCSEEDKNDNEIVGGSRRGAGWKRDHFDVAFSDIHSA